MFFSCGVETEFLSTPSARRATRSRHHHQPPARISIHALREEGDYCSAITTVVRYISIHALREEGDMASGITSGKKKVFLSTPSARRATFRDRQVNGFDVISIHALREEGDFSTRPMPLSV